MQHRLAAVANVALVGRACRYLMWGLSFSPSRVPFVQPHSVTHHPGPDRHRRGDPGAVALLEIQPEDSRLALDDLHRRLRWVGLAAVLRRQFWSDLA
eukprot:3505868-Pyramimonas_sp.AAC.1